MVLGTGFVSGLQHDVEHATTSVWVPSPPQGASHVPADVSHVPSKGLEHAVILGTGLVSGLQHVVEQVTTSVCVPSPPHGALHVPGDTFHVPVKGFEQSLVSAGFVSGLQHDVEQVTVCLSTPTPPQGAVQEFQPPSTHAPSNTVHTQGGPVFSHGLVQLSIPRVVCPQAGGGASQKSVMHVSQLLCPSGCALFSQQ